MGNSCPCLYALVGEIKCIYLFIYFYNLRVSSDQSLVWHLTCVSQWDTRANDRSPLSVYVEEYELI